MQNRRRHYFPANDCTVITGLCPNGEFGAYREDEDEGRVRGYGYNRFSAIADLFEQMPRAASEREERDRYADLHDHNRKLHVERTS